MIFPTDWIHFEMINPHIQIVPFESMLAIETIINLIILLAWRSLILEADCILKHGTTFCIHPRGFL